MARTSASNAKYEVQKDPSKPLKHKRRFCKQDGCTRIVKSQGLCQRHGAKPRKCKQEGCDKQAQGNFDRMCKSHFKQMKRATTPLPPPPSDKMVAPEPPEGTSVYEGVIANSINFFRRDANDVMPLVSFLKEGFDGFKPPAWHRNEERRARGLHTISNPATQLEGWERELVWMEILILTGAPQASFRHLARAWGRDKGFHMVLAQFICERHGNVERKKRQNVQPKVETEEQIEPSKLLPPKKQRRLIVKKLRRQGSGSGDGTDVISADVWDETVYNNSTYNEALAVDIFNFTSQDFANVSHRWKYEYQDDENSSDTASAANGPADAKISARDDGTRKSVSNEEEEQQQQQDYVHNGGNSHEHTPPSRNDEKHEIHNSPSYADQISAANNMTQLHNVDTSDDAPPPLEVPEEQPVGQAEQMNHDEHQVRQESTNEQHHGQEQDQHYNQQQHNDQHQSHNQSHDQGQHHQQEEEQQQHDGQHLHHNMQQHQEGQEQTSQPSTHLNHPDREIC